MIRYGQQSISPEDIAAVEEVLKSDWLTQGPVVTRFEEVIAKFTGAGYATAVNSGTSALHIACLALGLGAGDRVWTSPNTFVASANCALYCGASIDFVDIDLRTYNISIPALKSKLESAERTGTLPKIIIPVHFSGQSCDMRAIRNLSQRYGFHVIEDASHAVGGRYLGQPIGNCRYSDITVFSFHPVKIITTGEGGMAVTNSKEICERMRCYRSHGIHRELGEGINETPDPWYYQQVELGFNYRMTDIQAALGISQIQRIDEFISRRHILAQRYNKLLADLPLIKPWQHPDTDSAWHLYVIRLQLERINLSKREIFEALHAAGIGVQVHFIPIHTHPYYQALGFSFGDFPESEHYYREALSIPLNPSMHDSDQDKVIEVLGELLQ